MRRGRVVGAISAIGDADRRSATCTNEGKKVKNVLRTVAVTHMHWVHAGVVIHTVHPYVFHMVTGVRSGHCAAHLHECWLYSVSIRVDNDNQFATNQLTSLPGASPETAAE